MRIDAQPLHIVPIRNLCRVTPWYCRAAGFASILKRATPIERAPQGALEMLDRLHRDGVDHLLVELRIADRKAAVQSAPAAVSLRSTGS